MMSTVRWLSDPDNDDDSWWWDLCDWWSETYPVNCPTQGWILSAYAFKAMPPGATIPIRAGWNHILIDLHDEASLLQHIEVLAAMYQAVIITDLDEMWDRIAETVAELEIDMLQSDFDLSPDENGVIPAAIVAERPDTSQMIAELTDPDDLMKWLAWNQSRASELFGTRQGLNQAAGVAQELGSSRPSCTPASRKPPWKLTPSCFRSMRRTPR